MPVPDKILFYGATGSGKSTAATRTAQRLGVPLVLADEIGWLPGWVKRDRDEQYALVSAATSGGAWVADSTWSGWNDLIVSQADLIVGLDYSRLRSLWRLVRRTVIRSVTHEPICNGNYETLRRALARDSIIVWHFQTWKHKRERMRAWAADPAAPRTLLFRHPRELDAWIDELTPVAAAN